MYLKCTQSAILSPLLKNVPKVDSKCTQSVLKVYSKCTKMCPKGPPPDKFSSVFEPFPEAKKGVISYQLVMCPGNNTTISISVLITRLALGEQKEFEVGWLCLLGSFLLLRQRMPYLPLRLWFPATENAASQLQRCSTQKCSGPCYVDFIQRCQPLLIVEMSGLLI